MTDRADEPHKRNVYLEDIPIDDARRALWDALAAAGKDRLMHAEHVSLRDALGRVSAEPVLARISSPHYHASAMDGYAVRAADTLNATETRPLTLPHSRAHAVNTGTPLPPDCNAVIMIEHVQETPEGIVIHAPVAPWQHVRLMGEDMVTTEVVLGGGHVIRPVDLGALAGCGHASVAVRRKPHVIIIPTGSELVTVDQNPQPGQIIEYNSLVLGAQIEQAGGRVTTLAIQPDERPALEAALAHALTLQPDLLLLLSGSSAGSKDFTASVVQAHGRLLVHGVAVRPGHPVIMGMVQDTPVIGVPGYPVSAALTGELFITPLIARWLGIVPEIDARPQIDAQLTQKINSPIGDDDYVRVTLAQVGDHLLATPLGRGAGVITSLVRADGLAHVPRFSEGIDRGGTARVLLYRSPREIQNTVLTTGSHDPMLDLLATHLAARFIGSRLTSASVGSLGGLVALRRRETHMAGMHLLDEESGEYNISYIQKQLNGLSLRVVTFAHREQGLMVSRGNPHAIHTLEDLPRARFVNRQRGAGTRILLDYELKQRGIAPESIEGYAHEEYTHLAVAVAVASGLADCGMGVRQAATALGLDFVPVGWERYDLVIPHEHLSHPIVAQVLDVLVSDAFRDALAAVPGYDTREMGVTQYET